MNEKNFDAKAKQKQLDTEIVRGYRSYEDWARRVDLPIYQLFILYELLASAELTQKNLVLLTNLPKQSINKGVQQLKKTGYVVLRENSADHRSKIVTLTPAGHEYAMQKVAPLFELEETVLRKLGIKRLEELLALLRLYGDIFEQEAQAYWHKQGD